MGELLKKLGFHKNEVSVYLSLFELGKVRAGAVIDATGLHRNIVYTSLEALVERSLVTKTIVSGVAEFVANDPEHLVEEIDQKRKLAEEVVESLRSKQKEAPSEVVLYEGVEGVERSRNKAIQSAKGEDLFVIASAASSTPEMEKIWRKVHTKREKKGVGMKILYEQGSDPEGFAWRSNLEHTEARRLPFSGKFPVWFAAVADHFEIGIPGSNPLTFAIRNKEAADGFKEFFKFFWSQQVSTSTGIAAVQNHFESMLEELDEGEGYYVIGASRGRERDGWGTFFKDFHKKRIEKGVILKMLASHEYVSIIKQNCSNNGDPNFSISKIKKFFTQSNQPFQINLYKGGVYMVVYAEEPIVISFKTKEVHDGFKIYFDALWSQETTVLSGPEAIRDMWLEAIESGELRFIGARGYFIEAYPEMYSGIENAAKQKKGFVCKNIVDSEVRGHVITTYPWAQTKYSLPDVKNPNVVWLYGDTVAISNWTDNEPVLFVSKNKQLVQSYSDYFDGLWNQPTTVLSGHNGIKELCELVLEQGEDLYLIGATGSIMETHPDYYKTFTSRRIKKNITLRMLANSNIQGKEFINLFLSKVGYLPEEFESPMVIWIFGDYVANVMWHDPQSIFLIHNTEVADYYRTYYNGLSNIAK